MSVPRGRTSEGEVVTGVIAPAESAVSTVTSTAASVADCAGVPPAESVITAQ